MVAAFKKDRFSPTSPPLLPTPGSVSVTDITGDVRSLPAYADHEQIVYVSDPNTGLRAYIAVHDRTLGRALGGCRMWPYASRTDALTDVLRLSRGMTLKAAMICVAVGGGKAVIVGDSRKAKTPDLFRAFGTAINALDGRFVTGEDVGVSVADVDCAGEVTRHVVGGSKRGGGDPSPMTAFGVHCGIEAAARHRLGCENLAGTTVAVQGLGKVGYDLCRRLYESGAALIVSDIDPQATRRVENDFAARAVAVDEIHQAVADVFAPCALGGGLNDETVAALNCAVIAGSANNQLLEPRHGEALRRRGILYAPDFVINGGGLINVALELIPEGYNQRLATDMTAGIADTLTEIFSRAAADRCATDAIAERMALERLAAAGRAGFKRRQS